MGGLLLSETIEFLSKQVFFFDQKVGFPYKINESLMKIIEKSLKTAKIDREIAESGWILTIFFENFTRHHTRADS